MAPPPPPELTDDVTVEILLRIPPDEPALLVCKPWRRLLTNPAFLCRYRAFHRTPPLLGFLHNVDLCDERSVPRFVLTTVASPFSPPAIGSSNWWWMLDCRHGRVLILLFDPMELIVWDPITGDQHQFPQPPHPYPDAYCTGTMLCSARDCHHLDCHGGPFLVVFVASPEEDDDGSWACVYSSETGQWSSQACTALECFVEMSTSLLVQDTLYFNCEPGTRILEYDIGRHELSEIDPPLGHNGGILITSEDAGLGFATMEACGLVLWSRYVGYDGIAEWAKSRVIELDMTIPVGNPSSSGWFRTRHTYHFHVVR